MSTSHERLSVHDVDPAATQAVLGLEKYVRSSGLDTLLYELVKIRASQLNGCAYCLDMHSKDARAQGETEQRLYGLSAWREAPYYSDRERAALEWTEAITLISKGGISEELYATVRKQFSEKELVDLTMAVVTINGWNRLAIGLGSDVGSYQPAARAATSREHAGAAAR